MVLVFIILAIFGKEYKFLSSSLRIVIHHHVASFLLGLNILLNTLFSNTLKLCSSLNGSCASIQTVEH
jgi:hypothetical protein